MSSLWSGPDGHEVLDPGVKRNPRTLTQDTPTVDFSDAFLKTPFIEHMYCSMPNFVLEVCIQETSCLPPAVHVSFVQSSVLGVEKIFQETGFHCLPPDYTTPC